MGLRGLIAAAVLALLAGLGPQALAAGGAPSSTSFRDAIRQVLGVDLNIAGGPGQTQDDPVILLDKDPEAAARTQDAVLNVLGQLLGDRWRSVARSSLPGPGLQDVEIELQGRQSAAISTRHIYFSHPAGRGADLPATAITLPHVARPVPAELGWLHFLEQVDFEPQHPGLGSAMQYEAKDIAATLYVYDLKLTPSQLAFGGPDFRSHFAEVTADVTKATPDAKPMGPPVIDDVLYQQSFQFDAKTSLLGLGVYGGKLFKFRITFDTAAPGAEEAVAQSIDAIRTFIAPPR